jgi:maltose/moltooligosaccharide transporter
VADQGRLSIGRLIAVSVGFVGIQAAWGLQNANMSALYEKLGATPSLLPWLWLAAPVTALVMHPLIGSWSDRTWTRLGRRSPYVLAGAIVGSAALLAMPLSSSLAMAAALLWVQDAAINTTMEPLRPLVADQVGPAQRTSAFAVQSLCIGVGATIGYLLPYALRVANVAGQNAAGLPLTVQYSYWIGAALFIVSVGATVVGSRETRRVVNPAATAKPRTTLADVAGALASLPRCMRVLGIVQFLSWSGFFCLWMFFVPAIARRIFLAPGPHSPQYDAAIEWGGLCLAFYAAVAAVVAPLLPPIARRIGRPATHAAALACAGTSLVLSSVVSSPYMLFLVMAGVGVAWASLHSIPYSIVADAVAPDRVGVYMGLFAWFIAVPGIAASLFLRPLMQTVLGNDPFAVVLLGGVLMLGAAVVAVWIPVEQTNALSNPDHRRDRARGSAAASAVGDHAPVHSRARSI